MFVLSTRLPMAYPETLECGGLVMVPYSSKLVAWKPLNQTPCSCRKEHGIVTPELQNGSHTTSRVKFKGTVSVITRPQDKLGQTFQPQNRTRRRGARMHKGNWTPAEKHEQTPKSSQHLDDRPKGFTVAAMRTLMQPKADVMSYDATFPCTGIGIKCQNEWTAKSGAIDCVILDKI